MEKRGGGAAAQVQGVARRREGGTAVREQGRQAGGVRRGNTQSEICAVASASPSKKIRK